MRKTILTVATVAVVAVGAQAQMQYLKANQPYTFTGTAALGTGNMSYQWYRDGVEIPNATSQSYTMPASLARGADVEIMRGVVSTACPYNISYTNRFVITFVNCLQIGSVCWATANVDAYQTFAPRPDIYTSFYQWNRTKVWSATGAVDGWNTTITDASWLVNPCPTGWRMPTQLELQALHDVGFTWVDAGVRGAAVAGVFFGPNHSTPVSCMLPNNMTDCIFLSAAGYRQPSDGELKEQGNYGGCWSSTQVNSTLGFSMYFSRTKSLSNNGPDKAYGFNIRCVQ